MTGTLAELTPVAIRISAPRQEMAEGGLASQASAVRKAGRGGDTLLVHLNKAEYDFMKERYGEPTINPKTGIPEFNPFYKQKWFAPVAGAVASAIGAPFVSDLLPTAVTETLGATGSQMLSGGLLGAGVGALSGGAQGALTGGLAGAATPAVLNALGVTNLPSQAASYLGIGGSSGADMAGMYGPNLPAGTSMYPTGSEVGPFPAGSAEAARSATTAAASPLATAAGASSNLLKYAPLLLAASAMGGGGGPQQPQQATQPQQSQDPNMTRRLSQVDFKRTRAPVTVDKNYAYGPQQQFFENNALPGVVQAAQGRYVKGGGTGTSDSIPAVLSDGEYVIDAQTVSMLGDGSSDAGAKKLDDMRKEVRKHKGSALSKGKFAPEAKSPLAYMKGKP